MWVALAEHKRKGTHRKKRNSGKEYMLEREDRFGLSIGRQRDGKQSKRVRVMFQPPRASDRMRQPVIARLISWKLGTCKQKQVPPRYNPSAHCTPPAYTCCLPAYLTLPTCHCIPSNACQLEL
eukprot:1140536-Pelagomonas_calceolata.AAC.8